MNSREQIDHFLTELGAKLGISNLCLNEEGLCAFTYLNAFDFIIEVPESGNTVAMHSPLMSLKEIGNETLYKKLLILNFLGIETAGTTFAINQDTQEIVLCYRHPIEHLESTSFENLVGNFLEIAEEFWLQLSQEGSGFSSEAPLSPGPASS